MMSAQKVKRVCATADSSPVTIILLEMIIVGTPANRSERERERERGTETEKETETETETHTERERARAREPYEEKISTQSCAY